VDDEQFWAIMEASRAEGTDSVEVQTERLTEVLEDLSDDDLVAFDAAFDRLRDRLYTWDHWGAAYVALGGCSDDSFIDFRSWVISEGRGPFEAFLEDPEWLAVRIPLDEEEVGDAELFAYAAAEVYEDRTGDELEDAGPGSADDPDAGTDPGDDPSGRPFGESAEHLKARYPRLWDAVEAGTRGGGVGRP
jgi:hypothetical protein